MIKINLDDTLSTDVQPSDLARSVGGRARPPPGGPAVVPLQVFQEECRNIFDSIIYRTKFQTTRPDLRGASEPKKFCDHLLSHRQRH